MAKIVFDGLEEYLSKIEILQDKATEMLKESVYPAAGLITDKIREKIKSLDSGKERHTKAKRIMHYKQKEGLLNGLGLARMEETEFGVHTKVGFHGYNELKSKKYPKGQPNAMIARVVESGSTYQKKQSFIRPVVNTYKKEVENMIENNLDEKIKEVMK